MLYTNLNIFCIKIILVNSEYNTSKQIINAGSFGGQYTITPSPIANGTTITDDQIQAELLYHISKGRLPAAKLDNLGNPQTYYAMFFPPKIFISFSNYISCDYYCAYHGTVASTGTINEFYYGIHPDFTAGSGCYGGGCGGGSVFQNYCQVASHELVEMITGWYSLLNNYDLQSFRTTNDLLQIQRLALETLHGMMTHMARLGICVMDRLEYTMHVIDKIIQFS